MQELCHPVRYRQSTQLQSNTKNKKSRIYQEATLKSPDQSHKISSDKIKSNPAY